MFAANIARISTHNAEADEGHHSYRMGVNQFTDLTSREFQAAFAGRKAGFRAKAEKRGALSPPPLLPPPTVHPPARGDSAIDWPVSRWVCIPSITVCYVPLHH